MIKDYGREYKFKKSMEDWEFPMYSEHLKSAPDESSPEEMENTIINIFRSILKERGVKETADFLHLFGMSVHSGDLSRNGIRREMDHILTEEGREQAELEEYEKSLEDRKEESDV